VNSKTARWVLVLSSVASLMVALDALVVSTALGVIRNSLHASIDELEWTVNAYGLSFAVLLVPAAALGDRLGRRRLFAVGLGLFVLGSIACALSPNAGMPVTKAHACDGATRRGGEDTASRAREPLVKVAHLAGFRGEAQGIQLAVDRGDEFRPTIAIGAERDSREWTAA